MTRPAAAAGDAVEPAAIEAVATSLLVVKTAADLFGKYMSGTAQAFIGSLAVQEPSVLVLTQNRLDALLSEARQQGRDRVFAAIREVADGIDNPVERQAMLYAVALVERA